MPSSGVLLLRLEGPLQSWGERSRWDVRDSADRPTKSGVIGLLGCAFGYARGDQRMVELQDALRFGVRVDRAGKRMVDFQTVTGDLPSADGKSKGTKTSDATLLSPRAYLQDASFLVALEGEIDILRRCVSALESPRWPCFLGRKCCLPSVKLIQELQEGWSLEKGLESGGLARFRKPKLGERLLTFSQAPDGDFEMRDRYLGTPSREYGLNRYTMSLIDQPEDKAYVS